MCNKGCQKTTKRVYRELDYHTDCSVERLLSKMYTSAKYKDCPIGIGT